MLPPLPRFTPSINFLHMIATKGKRVLCGTSHETQPAGNTELENQPARFHNTDHITFTGIQVVRASIQKLSVSSTWVKPHRPGAWWNGVTFSI